jgi:hypothetical protein
VFNPFYEERKEYEKNHADWMAYRFGVGTRLWMKKVYKTLIKQHKSRQIGK